MDFVNELFSSTSCNVDGSVGMNPFTSFSDHILNSETLLSNTGFDSRYSQNVKHQVILFTILFLLTISSYELPIQDSAMDFPDVMSQASCF